MGYQRRDITVDISERTRLITLRVRSYRKALINVVAVP